MWLLFAVSTTFATCFIFLPGYLAARSLRLSRILALCVAPLLTFALIGLLAIAYGLGDVACTPLTLIALPAAILGLACAYRTLHAQDSDARGFGLGETLERACGGPGCLSSVSFGACALATGCAMGLILCLIVFVTSLATPDAFLQNYDNAWHLWRIHSFFLSCRHSSLGGGFYPSAYHSLCALVQAGAGVSSAHALNAVLYVLAALVFPAASTLLLATVFPDMPRKVIVGSLFCLSIAFFPWRLVLFGPLYPNIAAFSIMPAEAAAFIRLCSHDTSRDERRCWAIVFLAGGVACALTQPNAIFSTGVFLIPFCLRATREAASKRVEQKGASPLYALAAETLVAAAVAFAWLALYKAPFMQATIQYPRESAGSLVRALKWGLALCFMAPRQQYLLGIIVLVGLASLLATRRRRWMGCSYLLLIGLYMVAFAVDGEMKQLLTGFWYSDLYRLAAAACVFCVPVIAEGMEVSIDVLERLWAWLRHHGRSSESTAASAPFAAIVSLVVLLLDLLPLPFIPHDIRSFAFDTVSIEIDANYNFISWRYLEDDEVDFLRRASELVPTDEVMLNQPFDGSVFAGSVYGIAVRYNMFGPVGEKDALIRSRLSHVSTDPEVRHALAELGIRYLIQLDQSDLPIPTNPLITLYDLGYEPDEWEGINSVRDDTPGFTVLLSDGDMRLYRIDYEL